MAPETLKRVRMNDLRKFFLAVGLVPIAFPTTAAELDIPGAYGNEAGCRLASVGHVDGDDILLLTRRDVSTYATSCGFVQVYPAEADNQVALVMCGHEGEAETTLDLMRVQKSQDGVDAYLIFDETGASWGKAERCK
jgi:hypothetical protein